jgi:glycyl-tRNA synthetase beta subunit
MVMVDNENVKKNRLSLLSKIKKMADKICNMDKLII